MTTGLVALGVIVLVHFRSVFTFRRFTAGLVETLLRPVHPQTSQPVDPETLPTLVQSLVRRSGADPNHIIQGVQFRQTARLRMAPDKPWKPIQCSQTIAINEPGFVWVADQKAGPVTSVTVLDAYVSGEGLLEARLFGSIPVARMGGPGAAHSELMRYLAELAWAPDAMYHNSQLRWSEPGNNMVIVEADSAGGPAQIRLYFDERGDLVEIQADGREAREGKTSVMRPWRGIFSDYREIGGRRIPARGEVGYVYDSGYAAYFQGEILDYRVISPVP